MTNLKHTNTSLGERLRAARELAGLSQGQVARILELHRPSISEMEAGRRKVSADEIAKLAHTYGVSISWLTEAQEEQSIQDVKIELAARELAKLRPDDLERVLQLLTMLRAQKDVA